MSKLPQNIQFRYHAKCKEMQLSHLFFADDIMMLCRADKQSPLILKSLEEQFGRTSGLKINIQKFFCGVDVNTKTWLMQQLGFAEGTLPIRYLGLPLIASKLSFMDCKPIMDKIQQKITAWSAKLLTYAGRIMLVRSVLFHYQVFWSNVLFILPASVLKRIEKMCRNFIWNGKHDQKCMSRLLGNKYVVQRRRFRLGYSPGKGMEQSYCGR